MVCNLVVYPQHKRGLTHLNRYENMWVHEKMCCAKLKIYRSLPLATEVDENPKFNENNVFISYFYRYNTTILCYSNIFKGDQNDLKSFYFTPKSCWYHLFLAL